MVMIMAALVCSIPFSTISSTFDVMKYVSKLYIALSKPNIKPAMAKIITLKIKTVCPTGSLNLLFNRIATVSVPSRQPPERITRPTPIPNITPPKHTASRYSPVALTIGAKMERNAENTIIPKADFTMNCFPIFRLPISKNGIFNTTVKILRETPVILWIIMPIPTTPPSKMVQGTRNSSMAKAAMMAPMAIPIKSMTSFTFLFLNTRTSSKTYFQPEWHDSPGRFCQMTVPIPELYLNIVYYFTPVLSNILSAPLPCRSSPKADQCQYVQNVHMPQSAYKSDGAGLAS